MAAGLKIKYKNLENFKLFLNKTFDQFQLILFEKKSYFDSIISINELNNNLLETLQQIEPFGNGNSEPLFIIKDLIIKSVKIIKEKHILLFFENDKTENFNGICFNCINNPLGEYLLNFKKYKFYFGCSVVADNYNNIIQPQLIIKDAMIMN